LIGLISDSGSNSSEAILPNVLVGAFFQWKSDSSKTTPNPLEEPFKTNSKGSFGMQELKKHRNRKENVGIV
jgi:hypothetical protein